MFDNNFTFRIDSAVKMRAITVLIFGISLDDWDCIAREITDSAV